MTARLLFVLFCDQPDCGAEISLGLTDVVATRTAARKRGWSWHVVQPNQVWHMARSADHCPLHATLPIEGP